MWNTLFLLMKHFCLVPFDLMLIPNVCYSVGVTGRLYVILAQLLKSLFSGTVKETSAKSPESGQ